MSRPRKPRKGENPAGIYWHDDPEWRAKLHTYCQRDTELERELYRRLPPLSDSEQHLWQLDALINKRGFYVDLELAAAAQKIVRAEQATIDAEIAKLTGGTITSANQVAKLQMFLQERGHKIASLTKRSVSAMLAHQPAPDVKRLLELRREGAQAAARKLDSLIAGIDADQRLRGTLRFHGASTGRWSGSRFQPQNLKKAQSTDGAIEAVLSGDLEHVRQLGARWGSPAICRAP
jgi:DNA polymerase